MGLSIGEEHVRSGPGSLDHIGVGVVHVVGAGCVDEEVVAFDHYQRGAGRNLELAGDGFIGGPFEAWRLDRVVGFGEYPAEQTDESPAVEGVRAPLRSRLPNRSRLALAR